MYSIEVVETALFNLRDYFIFNHTEQRHISLLFDLTSSVNIILAFLIFQPRTYDIDEQVKFISEPKGEKQRKRNNFL